MTGKTSDHDERPRPVDHDWLRRVFGDVLPETTRDERDPEAPRRDTDTWYRENRPPHHDR
nr:hypothetical protein [Streptoalloteichus hindustanus]